MLDSDLKFILGSTYNDEFFTKGSNYRESLEKNGILILDDFFFIISKLKSANNFIK